MPQRILDGIGGFAGLKMERYLLVCGRSFSTLGIDRYFAPLAVFSGYTPNPLYEQVREGVRCFREARCEAIVAVGGGSAIDVAKCIKLFCQMPDDVSWLKQVFHDTGIPLIAIPTTAGTGSESTRHAVIYENGVKQSVCHESIIPDVAILEPRLLSGLPLYQRKCAMLDALCQCIESCWAVAATAESREWAVRGIRLILDNWRGYIIDGTLDAADAVMHGANFSGRAINVTATTAAHAMSYKLTSLCGLPHGHAVALCLPHVWRFLEEHADASLKRVLATLPISLNDFVSLMEEMNMARQKVGAILPDVETLVSSVNPERLRNSPVPLAVTDLREIYKTILDALK